MKPRFLHETRHVRRRRRPEDVTGFADLLDGPGSHNRNAVGQSVGLEQIVRDDIAWQRWLNMWVSLKKQSGFFDALFTKWIAGS